MNLPRTLGCTTIILVVAEGLATAPAQATTFNFSDEYYVSSLTTFHTVFGSSTSGYLTAGIYQETNTSVPTVIRLGSASAVPGEFVQNTSPNAVAGLQLFGWGASLNNGNSLTDRVYNLNNPINGTNTYFQYKTSVTGGLFGNGTTTGFDLNTLTLRGSTAAANLQFTLQAYDAVPIPNLLDSQVLTVTGNMPTTITLNWSNVDTVIVSSTTALPVNWGSGTLYLDSVVINNPIPAVPEPASIALLSAGLLGLVTLRRKFR